MTETRQPDLPSTRLGSIDTYRGLVMFLMMAEVLRLRQVAANVPDSRFWSFLAHHQTHAEWGGCSLHDLIQPSFSFLVGVALPFSIASRQARGQSNLRMTMHALWRALLLVGLGIFLRSTNSPGTNFTFEDTLTQIGLGYGFLFLLGLRPARDQWIALALILVGYWAAFALFPVPSTDGLSGFAAHWSKNTNLAWALDKRFMNLFPRTEPFTQNGGGYVTLSFIPTLGTMIFGLLAGGVLRKERSAGKRLAWLTAVGLAALASGWLLGWLGICPVVKRIWTPSWTLFSAGWCFLLLAAFHAVVDVWQRRAWAFPLIVIGVNSIAAYCMAHLFEPFIINALKRHLGESLFNVAGAAYQPLALGVCVLLVLWLILFSMYRKRVFLRI